MKSQIAAKRAVARLGLVFTLLVATSLLASCQQQPKAAVAPETMQNYDRQMKSGGLHPPGYIPSGGTGGGKPVGLGSSQTIQPTQTAPR